MHETPSPPQHKRKHRSPGRERTERHWRLMSRAGWLIATSVAIVVGLGLPAELGLAIRLFTAWNAGVITLLVYLWVFLLSFDAAQTRQRAAAEDPGRVVVFAISLLASVLSVVAAIVLLGRVHQIAQGHESGL